MLNIDIKYTGHPLTKSAFNEMKRETFREMGELWHREMRPKHFTHAGAREYGYAPRKGEAGNRHRKGFKRSYTGIKLRLVGHTRPLEFSGEGRRLSRIQDIRVTSKRVRVILPRKFNFRNPHSRVNMREELTTISEREERELVAAADRDIGRRLAAWRPRTRTKIG